MACTDGSDGDFMRKWIYVSTTYFTVSIDVNGDRITDTAPINRWVKGKSAKWYKQYLERKGILKEWIEYEKRRYFIGSS